MNDKNFAVIGHPIGHTMSPFIHSRLFALCGMQAHYRAEDIPDLHAALPQLRQLDGFNVTIPHKRSVIPLLDGLDRKAGAFGSVNTVKNENRRLTGFTTDGEGFRRSLKAAGAGLDGKTVILGAGGAARAIAFEAALAGGNITVATRAHSATAAEQLCEDIREKVPGAKIGHCLFSELNGPWDLLVNATPAGMFPNTDACPVSEDIVKSAACVFDAVYNPNETKLLRCARRYGKKAVGGMGMLVRQAAAAEEIWFGAQFAEPDLQQLCREAAFEMKKKFGNIILCGFMGSGKTTVGRLLAAKAGRKFIDLDEWIEQKEHMPVSAIFASRGEPAFREIEREAAGELSLESNCVIAAGGGTLLNAENAAALRANGITVFLNASLGCVRNRLKGDTARPLLRRPGGKSALAELYGERQDTYRSVSDFTVDADLTPEQAVQAILAKIRPGF